MTQATETSLAGAGVDAVAVKPTENALDADRLARAELVTVDYEGREHVPDADWLAALAAETTVRVTTPVRADGFDPRGDDSLLETLPESVGRVVVAGHPAYLDSEKRKRAVAPRLEAAARRAADPWVGTEGVERVALAVGGTQYELLGRATEREVRALRAAGFDGGLAVYAPAVLTEVPDAVLDAVGGYAARRGPVGRALPDGTATDSAATGEARETLLSACRDYALVGDVETVRGRVRRLEEAGVDRVVAYPARGLGAL